MQQKQSYNMHKWYFISLFVEESKIWTKYGLVFGRMSLLSQIFDYK